MGKRGRVRTDCARNRGYRIRLNDDENQILEDLSAETKLTKADVIREALKLYKKMQDYK